MLQRFRNLVEDVIEVTRVQGSAMATTIDEVKRVLTKSEGNESAAMPLSGSSATIDDRRDGTMDSPAGNSTGSRDDDKNLLKDLFDLRNFSLSTKPNDLSCASTVQVRQISSRKYKDSDSSEGSVDEAESSQVSYHSGSAFQKSSSVHTNTSSLLSGNETAVVASDSYLEEETDADARTEYLSDECLGSTSDASGPRFQTGSSVVSLRSPGGMKELPMAERRSVAERPGKTKTENHAAQVHRHSQYLMPDSYHGGPKEAENAVHPAATDHVANQESELEQVEGRGSWSSAASSSMPSIAITAAANSSEKTSGTAGSEEESEDIGEVFAAYGARKANSQTNLSKLSPFSKKRMGLRAGSRESIVSCYSNAGDENFCKFPVTGEILFGLNYNYRQSVLEVNIKQCRNLAAVDQKKNYSDPYVKTYLLPDRTKNGKRKTRIKKHSLNPVFDEVLKYHVTKSELETRTLSITIHHNDRFGRNDFLGEVVVPLDYYSFDNPAPAWHKLQDRPNQPWDGNGSLSPLSMLTYKGDLSICLKFVSAEHISGKKRGFDDRGELHVITKEARNLTAVRTNGYSDPFCKGYLLPDKSHDSKRKSPVIRRNCNPKWNHMFVFENVSWEDLQERSLELTIWDHDRLTTNDFLGGVRLNLATGKSDGRDVSWMDSTPEEAALWQAMLDRPNCWIEGTLLLRLHMNQRK